MKKILIFTATYNEIDNVSDLIKQIKENCTDGDILIIDDNSPDGTGNLLKDLEKKIDSLKVIIRDGKHGLDTAHKFAFDYARSNKYDCLITMDADLSHDPKEIPNFLKHVQTNDFVLGSRYMAGGKNELSFFRFLISFFGNKFIKSFLGLNCTEFTNSYRAFNLNRMQKLNLKIINSKGYSFFMETIFQIERLGYKIFEIPIIFAKRQQGKSKIPKIEIFRTLINVTRLFFQKRI